MRTSEVRLNTADGIPSIRFASNMPYLTQPNGQSHNLFYPPVAIPIPSQQSTHLQNYIFPQIYGFPNAQNLVMSGNHPLVLSIRNPSKVIADNSRLTSPNINTSQGKPSLYPASASNVSFTLSKWVEIVGLFDGNADERPTAGHLNNGKYFTQRSAGKDIYMVFNSISDYISNFVNYYFSYKNFSSDEKMLNLMDETGTVALKDLVKFPRLAQIGTSVEDISEALKLNSFFVITTMKADTKGIRRSDGWFPVKSKELPNSVSIQQSMSTNSNGDLEDGGNNSLKSSFNSSVGGSLTATTVNSAVMIVNDSTTTAINTNNNNTGSSSGDISNNCYIDNGNQQQPPNGSFIFINPSTNVLHQPIFGATTIFQSQLAPQSVPPSSHGGPPPPHVSQLLFPTPVAQPTQPPTQQYNSHHHQHVSTTFYPQNHHQQPIHYRHVWPNNVVSEYSGSPILYTSNSCLRPLIGAGGNSVSSVFR